MLENEIEKIKEIFDLFKQCELKIGELYQECAARFPEEKEFWTMLEKEERLHSAYVDKLRALFLENPHAYKTGRPFKREALITVIKGLEENIQSVKSAGKGIIEIVNISRDIEQSLIETRFPEFLLTENINYNSIAGNVAADTFQHRRKLEFKRNELKSRNTKN